MKFSTATEEDLLEPFNLKMISMIAMGMFYPDVDPRSEQKIAAETVSTVRQHILVHH